MLQCWEYRPDNRPSFKDCLSQLETLSQMYNMHPNHHRNGSYDNNSDHFAQQNESGITLIS